MKPQNDANHIMIKNHMNMNFPLLIKIIHAKAFVDK